MPNLSSHIQTFSAYDVPYADSDLSFDSMDGYIVEKSETASITFNAGAWELCTGPTLNDYIDFYKKDRLPIYCYSWSKRRQIRFRLKSQIDNDPLGYYRIGSGELTGGGCGFGLKLEPTKVRGFAANAVGETLLDLLTGLTPGDFCEHLYEIIFYPGNGVYFSIDGAFVGSITENLPEGDDDADRIAQINMFNDTNGIACVLAFSRIQISQDR